MDRLQRRFLVSLTAVALLAALAQGMSGMTDLLLFLTPRFLMAAMLLCGRYIAEDRIVRRWRARTVHAPARRAGCRWRPVAVLLAGAPVALAHEGSRAHGRDRGVLGRPPRRQPVRRHDALHVTAELPEKGIEPIVFEAAKAGGDHYVVSGAALGVSGKWTLEVVARVSDFDEHRANLQVPVR